MEKKKRKRHRRSKEPFVCGIYKITSPSGKIYIGQSYDCYERMESYKRLECSAQPKIYASIVKHGWSVHKWEIIEILEPIQNTLNEREIYWISFYGSWNTPHGLNLQAGGANGIPSDETRKKIGLASKLRGGFSEAARKAASQVNTGRIKSPIEIELLRKSSREWIRPEEEKARLRTLRIGLSSAMKGVTGKDHHASKPVYCIELDKRFDSSIDARNYLRKNGFPKALSAQIGGVCLRRQGLHKSGYKFTRRKAYGYTWRFLINGIPEEFTIPKEKRITPENHKQSIRKAHLIKPPYCKPVYCPDLNKTFISCKDAANYMKTHFNFEIVSHSPISLVCRNAAGLNKNKRRAGIKRAYGFSWEFILDGTYYESKLP